jgi:hypothetical protein
VWTKEKHSHLLTTIGKLTAQGEKKKGGFASNILERGKCKKEKNQEQYHI